LPSFKPEDIPPRDRDGARRRAQNHFQVQAERDATVKAEIAHERAVSDAKTAKLRALRLAKEEAERRQRSPHRRSRRCEEEKTHGKGPMTAHMSRISTHLLPARARVDTSLVLDLVAVLLAHPSGLRRWSVMRAMRTRAEKANREVTPKFEDDVERIFRRHCSGDSVRNGMTVPCEELFRRPKDSVGEVWATHDEAARAYLTAQGF
jgi:hypothetical protein